MKDLTRKWLFKKGRRHHNNKGLCATRKGQTVVQVAAMAKRMGVPFEHGNTMGLKGSTEC